MVFGMEGSLGACQYPEFIITFGNQVHPKSALQALRYGSDLEEQMISPQDLSRPILFPLLDNDDTVKVKLSQDGMFIRVGSSGFFPVPEKEQEHLWRLTEDRLHN